MSNSGDANFWTGWALGFLTASAAATTVYFWALAELYL